MIPRIAVYQIMPDRFAIGAPDGTPLSAADHAGAMAHPFYHREGQLRRRWDQKPELPPRGRDHFGGNLDGIVARLEHIAQLGADALYLTPIFPSGTNHRYDIRDYHAVDEALGGEPAFDRLVAALERRSMGLWLDGVFNHVGENHPWVGGGVGEPARRNLLRSGAGYRGLAGWRGYGFVPELHLDHPEVRAALLDGDEAAVRHWIRRGATGWRLDCANDLGAEVGGLIARVIAEEGGVDGAVGEAMSYGSGFVGDGRLDGVMNYYFRESVLEALALPSGEAAPQGRASEPGALQLAENLSRMARDFPPSERGAGLSSLHLSWNMLASHDTPRLATALGGGADDPTLPARLRLATALQYCYPGVPLVYYGEELALAGGEDPRNRVAMPWPDAPAGRPFSASELALVGWHRRLADLRRAHPALRTGGYVDAPQPGSPALLAFARVAAHPSETRVFIGNFSSRPVSARVFLPLPELHDALPLRDLLSDDETRLSPQRGALRVTLPPHGVQLFAPDDETIPGYSFFKRPLPPR